MFQDGSRIRIITGEEYFRTEFPIGSLTLTRWCKRVGETGVKELLAITLDVGVVDTVVLEKAITYPTGSKLLERSRQYLVRAAKRHGIGLRQNYNRQALSVSKADWPLCADRAFQENVWEAGYFEGYG